MSYKKGAIEVLSIKEAKKGQYGLSAPCGIKIGEDWFNIWANEDKDTNRVMVKDKSYVEVLRGMEIEFMYETNEKGYHDIDKKTLKIISSGSAVPPPVTQQPTEQEKVAEKAHNTTQDESLIMNVFRGMASMMAIIKFKDKPMPDGMDDKIERMAKRYYKQAKE